MSIQSSESVPKSVKFIEPSPSNFIKSFTIGVNDDDVNVMCIYEDRPFTIQIIKINDSLLRESTFEKIKRVWPKGENLSKQIVREIFLETVPYDCC